MAVLPPLLPLFHDLTSAGPTVPARLASPAASGRDVAEARAAFEAWIEREVIPLQRAIPPLPVESSTSIAAETGRVDVTVYARGDGRARPAHLHLHGGGFWLGSAALDAPYCRMLATEADCVVVAVDYRRAPEHPWPGPPQDCWAALSWLLAHAQELGVDVSRVSVGGSSAGACLAAATAIRARDEHVDLCLQILDIPVTDLTDLAPLVLPDGLVIDGGKDRYVPLYVSAEEARTASPLFAPSLAGVAPALIIVAENDQLRGDGLRYAHRLRAEGVPVSTHDLAGQFHGSGRLAGLIPEQAEALDRFVVDGLRQAWRRASR